MICLCTTCKNRASHLKLTLTRNLQDNNSKTKFVVLDYNSPDDLLEWLQKDCGDQIERGRLVVYSFPWAGPFRMAHAKNMAHRLGMMEGADILVNVDADNFTGEGFADYVAEQFEDEGKDIFLWAGSIKGQGKKLRGTSGRIAVTSKAFLLAGGYSEKYDEWGPDDKDFNYRLQRLGFKAVEMARKYLESFPHGDGVRFREYPHVERTAYSSGEFQVDPDATIANYGKIGCGIVFKNFDFTKPIMLEPLPTRIFGIGMHKTATRSLHRALQILGYDSAHWESGDWARDIWDEMNTLGRSPTVEKHYALSDVPIPILYDKLDRAYPGSKFILTIKDEAEWLRSVRNHWNPEVNPFRWEWDVFPFSNRIHREIYGQKEYDALVFLERYRKHNADVKAYFKNRPKDFVVMEMDKGAGWPELCGLLGKPIPNVVYPNVKWTAEC